MSGLLKRGSKPKATVSITLSRHTVSLGNELTGTILVSSEEEFDAGEIRVEISGFAPKAIPPSLGEEYSTASDKILWSICERVSSLLHLEPGFQQEIPFKVLIPARPCFMKYGVPRSVGWFSRLLDKIPSSRGTHKDPESWLQKNPEWRNKIQWTAKAVIAVKGRRDFTSSIDFEVPMPPLTFEEKRSVRKRTKYQAVAVIFGLPLALIGLYLREIWSFQHWEIWGPMMIGGLLCFVWGFPGLVSGIRVLRTKENP